MSRGGDSREGFPNSSEEEGTRRKGGGRNAGAATTISSSVTSQKMITRGSGSKSSQELSFITTQHNHPSWFPSPPSRGPALELTIAAANRKRGSKEGESWGENLEAGAVLEQQKRDQNGFPRP